MLCGGAAVQLGEGDVRVALVSSNTGGLPPGGHAEYVHIDPGDDFFRLATILAMDFRNRLGRCAGLKLD